MSRHYRLSTTIVVALVSATVLFMTHPTLGATSGSKPPVNTQPLSPENALKTTLQPSKFPYFDRIDCDGDIHLNIYRNASKRDVYLPKVQGLVAYVKNSTLFLNAPKSFFRRKKKPMPTAVIEIPALKGLTLSGRSSVNARHLGGRSLTIVDSSSGQLVLSGFFDLRKLEVIGSGWVSIRWVNAPSLQVYLGSRAKVRLAGVVGQLSVQTEDKALFDARRLRAKDIWLSGRKFSVSRVLPLRTLQAFISGRSKLYYYKRPATMNIRIKDKAAAMLAQAES